MEKKFCLGTTKNKINVFKLLLCNSIFFRRVFIYRRASTVLSNLFFLSESITEGGGNFPSDWNPSFPGQLTTFTYDRASGQYAEFYLETGEHPNMCDC